jgi:hypothetical protein
MFPIPNFCVSCQQPCEDRCECRWVCHPAPVYLEAHRARDHGRAVEVPPPRPLSPPRADPGDVPRHVVDVAAFLTLVPRCVSCLLPCDDRCDTCRNVCHPASHPEPCRARHVARHHRLIQNPPPRPPRSSSPGTDAQPAAEVAGQLRLFDPRTPAPAVPEKGPPMTSPHALTIGELATWAAAHPAPPDDASERVRREGRTIGVPPCCLEFFAALGRESVLTTPAVDAYWWLADERPDDERDWVLCPGCLGLPLSTVLDPTLFDATWDADRRARVRIAELWPTWPEPGPPRTPARDLAGTWSVAAFDRAHLGRDHLPNYFQHLEHCVRCVPALTVRGVLPLGWPAAAACRLVRRVLNSLNWRDTPHFRETLVTDARGRVVYHDGFDDLRAWTFDDFGAEEQDWDPPGSLMSLVVDTVNLGSSNPEDRAKQDALLERIGLDRMATFVARVCAEGPELGREWGWTAGHPYWRWLSISQFFGAAAALGRAAGLKWDHAALLAQAQRDQAVADTAQARLQTTEPD